MAESAISPENSINKKIINTVPIEYKIDGQIAWGQTLGLKARKLEVKALFITCLEHHLTALINTIEEAGVEVVDVVAAPVAASLVTLSKKQKMVGCLLADFGAETLSVVVFENNNLISLEVLPVGSSDITNDIALGLKISLDEAENVKLNLDRRMVYPKKKLEDIISSRLSDSFDLIQKHLKSIGRDSLLPAGIIITGRGADIHGIKSVAEDTLGLPSQLSDIHFGVEGAGKIRDRTWAIACGLIVVGFNSDDERSVLGLKNPSILAEGGRRWFKTSMRWVSQFLP
jgi:cell division protein FtsA